MLEEVKKRLNNQKYQVEFDDSVKKFISKKGVDKAFGARPLRRTIQNLVEDKIYDVECVAIESYDRKKEQMGWQALEFFILG